MLDLTQPGDFSDDLFNVNQPVEASRVMAVLDEINFGWCPVGRFECWF